MRLERVKDYLLIEKEYILNKSNKQSTEEREEREKTQVAQLRGSPLSVGSLKEVIDENHAIVSSSVGPDHYVNILSIVDKDQLVPDANVLLHSKVSRP